MLRRTSYWMRNNGLLWPDISLILPVYTPTWQETTHIHCHVHLFWNSVFRHRLQVRSSTHTASYISSRLELSLCWKSFLCLSPVFSPLFGKTSDKPLFPLLGFHSRIKDRQNIFRMAHDWPSQILIFIIPVSDDEALSWQLTSWAFSNGLYLDRSLFLLPGLFFSPSTSFRK